MPFLSSDLLAALPRLRRYARVLTEDPIAPMNWSRSLSRARQIEPESPIGSDLAVRLFSILRSVIR